MLDLHLNSRDTLLKFDQQLPVYNFYYPFPEEENEIFDSEKVLEQLPKRKQGQRALYFHIPFCDTLCTFCPFYRSVSYTYHEYIEKYLEALFLEMAWKSGFSGIGKVPVDVIAVGGGTPSVLSVGQIYRFGEKLHQFFDLGDLKEFTFELEVKSVTQEKLKALKEIGVNRVSFGVQAFNEKFRKIFNLTSTIEQVHQVAQWTTETFDYVNVDLIYGIAGQSLDELLEEADAAMALETTTIDFYPLNNMSASLKMHRSIKEEGLSPLSPATKISYRIFLDEYMRAKGYHPINGYSYTLLKSKPVERQVIIREPVFLYHDLLYGYEEDEVIGFGSSAISQLKGFTMYNLNSLNRYIKTITEEGIPPITIMENKECPEKGIVYFPYRGVLDKKRIAWDQIPRESLHSFNNALNNGLILDLGDQYTLTAAGWLSYVNLVYYLMPKQGQKWLSDRINYRIREGRDPDKVSIYQNDEVLIKK